MKGLTEQIKAILSNDYNAKKYHVWDILALIKEREKKAVGEALKAVRFAVNDSHAEHKKMPLLTYREEINHKIDRLLDGYKEDK